MKFRIKLSSSISTLLALTSLFLCGNEGLAQSRDALQKSSVTDGSYFARDENNLVVEAEVRSNSISFSRFEFSSSPLYRLHCHAPGGFSLGSRLKISPTGQFEGSCEAAVAVPVQAIRTATASGSFPFLILTSENKAMTIKIALVSGSERDNFFKAARGDSSFSTRKWAEERSTSPSAGSNTQTKFEPPAKDIPGSDPKSYERDRLHAEIEAERKKRQELENKIALDTAERDKKAAELERIKKSEVTSGRRTADPVTEPKPERRIALLIGNAAYKTGPLRNPVNDANDLDRALSHLGFETILVQNASIQQIREATRRFAAQVPTSDVALIYFAGHGVEVKGRNFLIPVDANISFEFELEDQAYDAGRWLDMLEMMTAPGRQRVNILILDACRDNMFASRSRSGSRGLARMDAPTGTFVSFATAPGKVAEDGAEQRNSPFTRNLIQAIQEPNTPIEMVFKSVRRAVMEETRGQQVPWDNSSLIGNFTFKK